MLALPRRSPFAYAFLVLALVIAASVVPCEPSALTGDTTSPTAASEIDDKTRLLREVWEWARFFRNCAKYNKTIQLMRTDRDFGSLSIYLPTVIVGGLPGWSQDGVIELRPFRAVLGQKDIEGTRDEIEALYVLSRIGGGPDLPYFRRVLTDNYWANNRPVRAGDYSRYRYSIDGLINFGNEGDVGILLNLLREGNLDDMAFRATVAAAIDVLAGPSCHQGVATMLERISSAKPLPVPMTQQDVKAAITQFSTTGRELSVVRSLVLALGKSGNRGSFEVIKKVETAYPQVKRGETADGGDIAGMLIAAQGGSRPCSFLSLQLAALAARARLGDKDAIEQLRAFYDSPPVAAGYEDASDYLRVTILGHYRYIASPETTRYLYDVWNNTEDGLLKRAAAYLVYDRVGSVNETESRRFFQWWATNGFVKTEENLSLTIQEPPEVAGRISIYCLPEP